MRYDKKSLYVAILWTSIAVIVGLFLWWNRKNSSGQTRTVNPSIRISPAVSPRNRVGAVASSSSPNSVLITLNEIFISSDPSLSLVGTLETLAELTKAVKDTYLVYTVPAELAGGDEVAASVRERVEEIFASSKLLSDFKKHRILYTNTREGRISVARQLQVELTIDPDTDLVEQLQGKVPNVACVSDNVEFAKILRKFFS